MAAGKNQDPLTEAQIRSMPLEWLIEACEHYGLDTSFPAIEEEPDQARRNARLTATLQARLLAFAGQKTNALPCTSCRFRAASVRCNASGQELGQDACLYDHAKGAHPQVTAWRTTHFDRQGAGCPGGHAVDDDHPAVQPPLGQRPPISVSAVASHQQAGLPWRVRLERRPRVGKRKTYAFYEVVRPDPNTTDVMMRSSSRTAWEELPLDEALSMLESLTASGWAESASTGSAQRVQRLNAAPIVSTKGDRPGLVKQLQAVAEWQPISREDEAELAQSQAFQPLPDDLGDGHEPLFDPRPRRVNLYRAGDGKVWVVRIFPGGARDCARLLGQ